MKEMLVAAIGIWLVFVLVFASLVGAETGQASVPASKAAPIASAEVSGRKSVDSVGRTVLLARGARFMSAGSVKAHSVAR